ncbi:helix-turn-helix domain-containing protein [Macrococcoides caseolyticum]|uniref:helix-turn-helix domain-containing protein n=1 Tax=Macrococcoides caseolyticum TaxID=69966 RepID=UPI001C600B32|nr:helix-turn-helix transcriptional regulator [Macrococcus caseolyticus]QYA35017.1 helix-turn-helix domain-containing protein [Macrococcus caseolyticus]
MNGRNVKKELGSYLKNIRKEKKITATELAKQIGYTQGHVSGIENGTKTLPNSQFVHKYLNALVGQGHEYNKHVKEINKITNGSINLKEVKISKSNKEQEINIIGYINAEGTYQEEYINVPINSLSFHLKDYQNAKFFGDYKLQIYERRHLFEYMFEYLKDSLSTRMSILKNETRKFEYLLIEFKESDNKEACKVINDEILKRASELHDLTNSLRKLELEYSVYKKQ